MSMPKTQIVMLEFPPCELPEFMAALCSALPGSVWFSEVVHQNECLAADKTLSLDECSCDVAAVVIIKRLPPVFAEDGVVFTETDP